MMRQNTMRLLAEHLTSLGMEAVAAMGDESAATFSAVSSTSVTEGGDTRGLRIVSSIDPEGLPRGNYLVLGGAPGLPADVATPGANVVAVPRDADFARVWAAVQDVCSAQAILSSVALDLLSTLDDEDAAGRMAQVAARALGNPVAILDGGLSVVASSTDASADSIGAILPDRPTREELVAARGIAYTEEGPFGGRIPHLVAGMMQRGQGHYLLLCYETNRHFSGQDLPLLRSLAFAMRLALPKERIPRASADPLPTLVARALEHDSAQDTGLHEQLMSAGVRLAERNHLLVFVTRSSQGSQEALSRTLRQVRSALPRCASTICEGRVVCFLDRWGNDLSPALELLDQAIGGWDDAGIRCGVSMSYASFEELPRAFSQCLFALGFGTRYMAADHILLYRRFVQFDLFSQASRSLDLGDFCLPVAVRIMEHDRRNQTEYAWTLMFYLGYFKSLDGAAAELHVHRNTVGYRLARATELFGLDLDDVNLCNLLLLSLEILIGQEVMGR